jgi:ATP phosphoribosyltransferase
MTSVPSTQVEPTAVYLPNNRRLAEQIAAANLPFPESAGRVVLRGEDIPLVMNRIARRSQAAVGITGDDLLDDWLAAGNELDERVTRSRILWNDARAVYGKPALCLIAAQGGGFEPQNARIAVCARYQNLAARFLEQTYGAATLLNVTPFSGGTETLIGVGLADAVIDIVVTGSTIRSLGLEVREVIYTSDLALLEVRP